MGLIKNNQEIATLRAAGHILSEVLQLAAEWAVPDISLVELDGRIHTEIVQRGCTPSFLGYDGFPNASCLSLNSQVVHGIPDHRKLSEGDVLGIDLGLWQNGLCVDAAITVGIGSISPQAQALLNHTQEALTVGIKAAKPFRRVGAISASIQEVAERYGHGIVRALTGHGVGNHVHEPPEIPNFGKADDGILLKPGMVLAIEPMFTNGGGEVHTEVDGWGIVTADGSLAAQFEHTVLITSKGVEVLTR